MIQNFVTLAGWQYPVRVTKIRDLSDFIVFEKN